MNTVTRLVISALAVFALTLFAGCAMVADDAGLKVGNPKDFAEATHIARLSQEAVYATEQAVRFEATRQTASVRATATSQAIAAYAFRAEADIARARADAEQNAQPAAAAGKALAYLGVGVGVLVLLVGMAFASVAWVGKRATTIYPDKRGQFPVVVRRGPGWVTFHDPNRALGPATLVRTPTLLDAAAGVILAIKAGKPTTEVQAAFPLPGSEGAMLQIATQQQAAQVRIAENPDLPKLMFSVSQPEQGQARQSAARGRMPNVTLINDPRAIETFEQKLLAGGDE